MAEYLIQSETLTAIADAVRSKTGETGLISAGDLATKISGINGCEVMETTIDPDFSNGNIEIVPDDGVAFSKVTVQKPDTLIPENIAEGVDIAGVIGALASGGGVKVAVGTYSSASSPTVKTHNLGCVPDIILAIANNGTQNTSTSVKGSILGFKKDFADANGISVYQAYTIKGSIAAAGYYTDKKNDVSGSAAGLIHNANENTFNLPAMNVAGIWIAIGGLI